MNALKKSESIDVSQKVVSALKNLGQSTYSVRKWLSTFLDWLGGELCSDDPWPVECQSCKRGNCEGCEVIR